MQCWGTCQPDLPHSVLRGVGPMAARRLATSRPSLLRSTAKVSVCSTSLGPSKQRGCAVRNSVCGAFFSVALTRFLRTAPTRRGRHHPGWHLRPLPPLNAFNVLPGLAAAEQLRPGSRDCDACTCKRQYQPPQSKQHDIIRTLHQASSWLPITSNSTLAAAAEDVG
jgi:hypothetical protein